MQIMTEDLKVPEKSRMSSTHITGLFLRLLLAGTFKESLQIKCVLGDLLRHRGLEANWSDTSPGRLPPWNPASRLTLNVNFSGNGGNDSTAAQAPILRNFFLLYFILLHIFICTLCYVDFIFMKFYVFFFNSNWFFTLLITDIKTFMNPPQKTINQQ